MTLLAKTAVAAAPYGIDKPYDYRVPEELEGKDFSGGIAALLEQGTTLLGEALRGNLRGAVLILGVVLLCGAADAVLRTPESPMRRFLPMAGAAAIAVLSLGSMKSLLGLGTQTIEELDVFSKALLPTLAAAVAANLIDRYDEKRNQKGDTHE